MVQNERPLSHTAAKRFLSLLAVFAAASIAVTSVIPHVVVGALGDPAVTSLSKTYTVSPLSETSFGYAFTMTSVAGSKTAHPALTGEVILRSPTRIRVRVYPSAPGPNGETPYVVPDAAFPNSTTPAASYTATPKATRNYLVTLITKAAAGGASSSTSLRISSADGSVTLLTVELSTMVMDVQMLSVQFGYQAGSYVSGYGERNYQYFLNTPDTANSYGIVPPSQFSTNNTFSIWNTDNGTPWKNPMYGTHPFFVLSNPVTQSHVSMLLLNSHAQQATIDGVNGTIIQRLAGGIVDAHIYVPSAYGSGGALSTIQITMPTSAPLRCLRTGPLAHTNADGDTRRCRT